MPRLRRRFNPGKRLLVLPELRVRKMLMNLYTESEPYRKNATTAFVERELIRSCAKYDWSSYSRLRMVWVVACELWEMAKAALLCDDHGPHGLYIEAAQLSAVGQKIMLEISRRGRLCDK